MIDTVIQIYACALMHVHACLCVLMRPYAYVCVLMRMFSEFNVNSVNKLCPANPVRKSEVRTWVYTLVTSDTKRYMTKYTYILGVRECVCLRVMLVYNSFRIRSREMLIKGESSLRGKIPLRVCGCTYILFTAS